MHGIARHDHHDRGRHADAGEQIEEQCGKDHANVPPVIPGWSEGPDPESRDSGFALRAPRNDMEMWSEIISSPHRYGASSSMDFAISRSQRSPLARSFALS